MSDLLTCQELVELVSDYLEDALPVADRARIEDHLADCGNCAAYLRQMRETIALLGALPNEPLSTRTEAELRVVFREWKVQG